VPNGWPVKDIQYGYQGLLVAVSSNNLDGNSRLTFWRMSSPCRIAYSHSLPLDKEKGDFFTLGLDDHFLVVFSHAAETNSRKIYIISTETKTVLEKLTIPYAGYLSYEQGVIIMEFPFFIR
jgi:hypothetical protein